MEYFLVNANAQAGGEHEVHRSYSCNHLPNPNNQISLGQHPNCRSALADAERRGYRPADGCAYCCPECHKE